MVALDRLIEQIERQEKKKEEQIGISTPTYDKLEIPRPAIYEFYSAPPQLDRQNIYQYSSEVKSIVAPVTTPKTEPNEKTFEDWRKKAEELRNKRDEYRFNTNVNNLTAMLNSLSNLGNTVKNTNLELSEKAAQIVDQIVDIIAPLSYLLTGQAGRLFSSADPAKEYVKSLGRGVMYGIFGIPKDKDISKDIAAIKATGLGLMLAGAAGGIAGVAGGAATKAASSAMNTGLIGWALTDNYAGRLEFLSSQAQKEKKQYDKTYINYDIEKKKSDFSFEELKKWIDYKTEKELETEEEKLALRRRYYDELERKQEEDRKYWEEVEKRKRESEEEKRTREEKERRYWNVINTLRSYVDSAKTLYDSSRTAYFNDRIPSAYNSAVDAIDMAKKIMEFIDANADILKETGDYEWLREQASSLLNAYTAWKETLEGHNPTRYVRNTATKYGNSTKHFNRKARSIVYKTSYVNPLDPSEVEALVKLYLTQVHNAATGQVVSDAAAQIFDEFGIIPEQNTKLAPETIVKFRNWIKTHYKTPLSNVSNYIWNKNSGYSYDSRMLSLIYTALSEAGVSTNEVANLSLRELEAILRARQYIYVASKRGYFEPYEYELYTRLKELLLLTDEQVEKLISIEIPEKKGG